MFNDIHAAVAIAGSGQLSAADAHLQAVEAAATERGSHARVVAEVGLPVVRGIYALAYGDPAGCADLLLRVRGNLHRIGGSNAQRDVVSLTLLAAAEAAGDTTLAAQLATARLSDKPESPFARSVLGRLAANDVGGVAATVCHHRYAHDLSA